ncbi:MAG: hypothetical protein H0X37_22380 [Herpetosiphonaceae bacterium]|nr:hypothetical protein [Herpetosiphonaceae bacterium]
MSGRQPARQRTSFATLRQFTRERVVEERCELCGAVVSPDHQHMSLVESQRLLCCCDACAILLSNQGGTKYHRVPRRVQFLPDFRMTDIQWDSLLIPIAIAFFFQSTPANRVVALYPSPAGATESLLSLEAWSELVQDNPVLQELEPDVEALLVNRLNSSREYFRVPIDECYKLVGLIRINWRGFSGGSETWAAIDQFLAALKERSLAQGSASRA